MTFSEQLKQLLGQTAFVGGRIKEIDGPEIIRIDHF